MDSGYFTLHDISPVLNERMGRIRVPLLAAASPQCARRWQNASEAARWMWHNLKVRRKLFHFTGGNVLGPFTPLFSSFVSPSPPPSISPSVSLSLPSPLSSSLHPVAPRCIQFCSFIPASSPARFLPFISPLLPSHPHIYHYFSSARSPARPLALPLAPRPPSTESRRCNLPRLILSIALNNNERAPDPPCHR